VEQNETALVDTLTSWPVGKGSRRGTLEARRLRGSVEQRHTALKGKPETGWLAGEIHFQVSGLGNQEPGAGARVQVRVRAIPNPNLVLIT